MGWNVTTTRACDMTACTQVLATDAGDCEDEAERVALEKVRQ